MRGGVAGRGARGGKGGVDSPDAVLNWDCFKVSDPASNSTTNRVYPSGYMAGGGTSNGIGATNLNGVQLTGGNRLFAIPQLFPKSGYISRIMQTITGGNASVRWMMNIYDDSGPGNPYPQNLLYTSGDLTNGGGSTIIKPIGMSVSAGSLLWFVTWWNTAADTAPFNLHCARGASLWPILGTTIDTSQQTGGTLSTPAFGVGWGHSLAYSGAAPATFPTSAPYALTSTNASPWLPIIYYGFQET